MATVAVKVALVPEQKLFEPLTLTAKLGGETMVTDILLDSMFPHVVVPTTQV